MIAVETISAMAPGWFIVAALGLLALSLVWVAYEGWEQEEQVDRLLEDEPDPVEPKTVRVRPFPYDWEHENEGGVR